MVTSFEAPLFALESSMMSFSSALVGVTVAPTEVPSVANAAAAAMVAEGELYAVRSVITAAVQLAMSVHSLSGVFDVDDADFLRLHDLAAEQFEALDEVDEVVGMTVGLGVGQRVHPRNGFLGSEHDVVDEAGVRRGRDVVRQTDDDVAVFADVTVPDDLRVVGVDEDVGPTQDHVESRSDGHVELCVLRDVVLPEPLLGVVDEFQDVGRIRRSGGRDDFGADGGHLVGLIALGHLGDPGVDFVREAIRDGLLTLGFPPADRELPVDVSDLDVVGAELVDLEELCRVFDLLGRIDGSVAIREGDGVNRRASHREDLDLVAMLFHETIILAVAVDGEDEFLLHLGIDVGGPYCGLECFEHIELPLIFWICLS